MSVTLIAHRPLSVDDWRGVSVRVNPGDKFTVADEDAIDLETRGLARLYIEAKSTNPPENKMLLVPENKSERRRVK